jgi:uncharacterized protein (DUF1778 family)
MENQNFPVELGEEPIVLNAEESERFIELMESPPKPNEALKRAMARYYELQNPSA